VVIDKDGLPVWDDLRRRRAARAQSKILEAAVAHPASLMAFDLLQYDGQDLRDLPLTKGLY
jgi:ATP-dependent DNA ligase